MPSSAPLVAMKAMPGSRSKTYAVMLSQELQPRLDLVPGLGGEELFGVGAVGKGRLLKTEKGFPHVYFSFVYQGGSSPLPTASTSLATPSGLRSLLSWFPMLPSS
jgi:hypothetical protein